MTEGRAGLGELEVELPRSWLAAGCLPHRQEVREVSGVTLPDLVVSHTNLLWTLQHGACAVRGHHINLPAHLLTFNKTELDSRADQLVKEWTKLEFGVFSQSGYAEDPLYPLSYTTGNKTVDNTGCQDLFCPSHDRFAPTKQNILCDGRPAISVMTDQLTALPINTTEAAANSSVRYVTQSYSSYVLVLDLSHTAERWRNIKRALFRLISLLPEGSRLGIVTVSGEEARISLAPTVVTGERREALHGLIPRRAGQARGCVQCGLTAGLELLGPQQGNIILLTNSQTGSVENINNHHIYNIIYASQEYTERTNTRTVYSLLDETSATLTEVFLDILNHIEDINIQKIYHQVHTGSDLSGKFYIEEFANRDVTVTLSVDDEQNVESFEVLDPSGKRNIFSKFEDGLVIIRQPGRSKSGMWSYRVRLYEDSEQTVLDVTSVSEGGGVTVKTMPTTRDQGQFVLLARVLQGSNPVLDAKVTAHISGPGGDLSLRLRDTGLASPDITRGDGVYSAFIPVFARYAGYHSVRITVESSEETSVYTAGGRGENDSSCCGSSLGRGESRRTGQFSRYFTQPSLYIIRTTNTNTDVTPPSKITDLHLVSTNTSSLQISLSWTAPGGDLDSGRVRRYEVRCETDPSSLTEQQLHEGGIPVTPSHPIAVGGYLSQQNTTVPVPSTNQIFYYAIISYDQAGNQSPVSNIVSASIEEVVSTTDSTTLSPATLRLGSQSWLLNTNTILAIAATAGGVLVIIFSAVIFMICRARRNTEKKSQDVTDTYEAGFYPDIKISKAEAAESDPTADGVYNWLDGLQQSHNVRKMMNKGTEQIGGLDLCYEEGSSCSRPTTSTDDSLSHEDQDYRNTENNNLESSELGQMSRTRVHNSFKQTKHPTYNNIHRYGHLPGQLSNQGQHRQFNSVKTVPPSFQQMKKQRHESVV